MAKTKGGSRGPQLPPKKTVEVDPEVAHKVTDLKNSGNRLFAQREYDKAILAYDEALKALPEAAGERSDLLCNKAACFYSLSKFKDAVKECGAALDVSPGSIKALRHRAKALEKQGLYKQALADIQSINKTDSASDDTRQAERRLRDLVAGRRPSLANGGARAAAAASSGGAPGVRGSRGPINWPFSAKVTLGGETRLVQLTAAASYADLSAQVAAKFPNAGPVALKYLDKDGDLVTITCRNDVQAALAEALKATDRRLGVIPPIRVTAVPVADQSEVPRVPLEEVQENMAMLMQQQQQAAASRQAAAAAAAAAQQQQQQQAAKQVAQTPSGEVIEIDDWLVEFANLFRDVTGIDADRHIDAHNDGWAATTRAMETLVRSDEAAPLFDRAVERFKEVAASGFTNWGNVLVCMGHKALDVAALEGRPLDGALAKAVAKDFDAGEAKFKKALEVAPGHVDALCALASLEFDRAKLAARLHIKPPSSLPEGVEEGTPEAEAAAKAAADDSIAATREALAKLKASDVKSAGKHMDAAHSWHKKALDAAVAQDAARKAEAEARQQKQQGGAAEAAPAGGEGAEAAASSASHAQVLWGNSLYEWSQVVAAVGGDWRALLDDAVARFKDAGCAEADIRNALKNHTQAAHLDLGPDPEPEPTPEQPAQPPPPQQPQQPPQPPQQQHKAAPPEAKGLPTLERKPKDKAAADK